LNQDNHHFEIIGKTFSGLEEVLAGELRELGAKNIRIITRGIKFDGNQEILYKANYYCRTAIRFLKPIADFSINNETELYKKAGQVNWGNYLDVNDTLAINAVVSQSLLKHSQYVALKTKDAIVDQFRRKFNKRPSVNTIDPTLRIHVHIRNNHCTISLDSSGSSLHLRGYRIKTITAPINEVLAAGLIMLSGWDKRSHFIDPMCGSGTIVIEAAMIAQNIPSGKFRDSFGFLHWKDYDAELWNKIQKKTNNLASELSYKIVGLDISDKAVHVAKQNIISAGLQQVIEIRRESIDNSQPPKGHGVMITNPPYGERMQTENIIELYKKIGDSLKQQYTGYEAWVLSSDFNALKYIGLRPSRKIKVYNGQLECKFVKFDIYSGSKKNKSI
jgi:putative N6-adenine-specific DNA methylase